MKLSKLFAAAAISFSALSANASLLSIVGGNVMDIPSGPFGNNFESTFPVAQSYNVGGNLKANAKLIVEYYYLASEAGFVNNFQVDSSVVTNTVENAAAGCFPNLCDTYVKGYNSAPIVDTVAAGNFLDFTFWTQRPNKPLLSVTNGFNTTTQADYNFATALNTTFHGVAYDAILFLDDTGKVYFNGYFDDDNHDDMIIGVRVRAVPEPSTVLLIGLGLIGLAGARRLKA